MKVYFDSVIIVQITAVDLGCMKIGEGRTCIQY